MQRRSYVDRFRIDLALPSVVRHPDGRIDAWGVARRVGVLQYPEDGTAELVDGDAAFGQAWLDSMVGLPLTIDHPAVGDGMVNPDNYRDLNNGTVLRVVPDRDAGDVKVLVRLASRDAIDAAKAGKVELSLGYSAAYQPGAGVWTDGTPYTGRQVDPVANHLALVDLARAGRTARLRLDGTSMHTITINGRTHKIAAFLAAAAKLDAVEPAKAKADAIEVGTISIDGTELTLPKATIDAIVAMLTGGAPASAEPPMDAAAAAVPGEDPNKAAPPRMDAAAIEAIVERAVAAKLDAAAQATALRTKVLEHASAVLGDGGDLTGDTWDVASRALVKADSAGARKSEIEARIARARKADAFAQGQIVAELEQCAAKVRIDAGENTGGVALVELTRGRIDAAMSNKADGEVLSLSEQARQRMLARMRGDKATTNDKGKAAG